MPETLVATFDPEQDEEVLTWRITQLEKAGMPKDMAEKYGARRDVDLGEFRVLLKNGCPPHLVAQISSLEVV